MQEKSTTNQQSFLTRSTTQITSPGGRLYTHASSIFLVHDRAVPPDLPLRAGEHPDAAHLHHGRREVGEELGRVRAGVGHGGLPPDVGPRGGVVHERLVGGEEGPALRHVPVVAGVERPEAARVHLHQRRRVAGAGALALQPRDVALVQGRVRHRRAAEVVEPVGELGAVGGPECVTPCCRSTDRVSQFQ